MPYQYNPPETISTQTDVMNDALRGVRRGNETENAKVAYLQGLAAFLVSPERAIPARFAPYRGESFRGAYLETSARTSRPQGIRWGFEGSRLPTPTGQRSVKMRLGAKKLSARTRITPEARSDIRGGDSSFRESLGDMLAGIREQLELETNEVFLGGRHHILGRISGTPTAGGVATLQPVSGRGYSATTFYDRGLPINQDGLYEAHPFYRDMRIAGLPSTSAFDGNTYTQAANTWASGDGFSAAAEVLADNEVYIDDISGSAFATPTLSLARVAGAADLSAVANINGAKLIAFGSRRAVQHASSSVDRIDTHAAMEGGYGYLTGSTIYDTIFGVTKASVSGLMPNTFQNAGVARTWTDEWLRIANTQEQIRSGQMSSQAFTSWSVWSEVAQEHAGLKRLESVIGNGGTTKFGDTPVGFAYLGGGGQVEFFPHHLAYDGDILKIHPEAFSYVSSWNMTKAPDRFVPDFDVDEMFMSMRGNVYAKRAFNMSIIADISNDRFQIT